MRVRGRSAFIKPPAETVQAMNQRDSYEQTWRTLNPDAIPAPDYLESQEKTYLMSRLDHLQAELNFARKKLDEHLDIKSNWKKAKR
jgi:hypothetical protein